VRFLWGAPRFYVVTAAALTTPWNGPGPRAT
jgi:hypothetical protein